VAHELGHIFGLTHGGPDDDCMQFGFYRYVNQATTCQFSAENRSIIINDPQNQGWLSAKPGDRLAATAGEVTVTGSETDPAAPYRRP
jgi:hypothetical protein